MICPQCNAENRDGAKFCDECGTRLAPASDSGEIASNSSSVDTDETETLPQTDCADSADGKADLDSAPTGQLDALRIPEILAPSSSGSVKPPAKAASIPEIEIPDVYASDSSPVEGSAQEPPLSNAPDSSCESDHGKLPLTDVSDGDDSASLDAAKTNRLDLSGFDEYLPEGSYTPPTPSWRDGGTMRMPRIEDDDTQDDQKSFRAPKDSKKSRLGVKIALSVIVVLAFAGAIAAFATYQLEMWGGKIVPDVVGMTQADATNTLQSKGFNVRATQVKSDETEGIVLLMDPSANARVDEGGEVVIHVAVSRTVPAVTGLSRADAEAAIAAEGLDNVNFVTERSDQAEGTVLSVDPAEGEKVRANTAITIVVAEPFRVPGISGMTQDQAATAMSDAGLTSHIEYVYNEEVAEGTVLGSNPAEGEVVAGGSDIAIQVALSRGTELVNATQYFLSPGATVVIDGVNYDIVSCDSVSYQGSETTAYSITAKPFTYFLGVKLPLEARTVSGTITWNADNTIASGAPSIAAG